MQPPYPVQPGDVLDGKYAVQSIIGTGGMGVVVAARHVELDTPVAVKILAAQASEVWKLRFLQEARTACQIDSEHVARVFDVGRLDDGTPYLVMELLEGRDLDDVLYDDGPLPIATAIDYALQACEALSAAHERGIVHRDVKPSNLFLTQREDGSDCIKLLDFGISKMAPRADQIDGELTRTGTCLGSPPFMSPEQLASCRQVDARSDVWSLGVSLFELLTDEAAFEGTTVPELYTAILRDGPRRLRDHRADAPAALEAIILRCLTKEADERVQSAAELAELLRPLATATDEADRRAESAALVDDRKAAPPSTIDELDRTPSGSVRSVDVTIGPRARRQGWSGRGAVVIGGLLGAAIAVAWSWPTDAPPALATNLQVAASPIRVIQSPAPAVPSSAAALPLVYSMGLSDELRRQLEGELAAAAEELQTGEHERVVGRARAVMRQLGALGVEPGKANSSLGARAQLMLGRVEAAKVRELVQRRPKGFEEIRAWAKRVEVQIAHARVLYDKVNAWGVRSYYRCGLLEMAALDRQAGKSFTRATPGEPGRRRDWFVAQARLHLKHARISLRHALHVQSETMLCVAEARQALQDVSAELVALHD